MSVDDLGVAAAVREHIQDWSPEGDESDLHDYRTSICEFLDGRLNPSLGADQHVVESHRSGASPDVVVDDSVGILVEPVVSEGGQGRLRTRLDRFEDEYGLLVVVAVDIRNAAAWGRLQDEHTAECGVSGAVYGFVAAPPPPTSESRTMDNGEAHSPFRPLLIPLSLLVAYLLFRWQFDQPVVNEVGLLGVVVVATVVGVLPLFLRWGPVKEGGRIIGGMLLLAFFLLGMISLYALFSWTVSAVPAVSVETVGGAGAAALGTLFLILRFSLSRWLSLDKWNRRE